jgi:hypothetical protein
MMNESSEPRSGNLAASGPGRKFSPTIIALAAAVVVSGLFILQNREFTTIDFLFFELHNRVWTAIASAIVLGVVLDRLFLRWWGRRKAAKNPQ